MSLSIVHTALTVFALGWFVFVASAIAWLAWEARHAGYLCSECGAVSSAPVCHRCGELLPDKLGFDQEVEEWLNAPGGRMSKPDLDDYSGFAR